MTLCFNFAQKLDFCYIRTFQPEHKFCLGQEWTNQVYLKNSRCTLTGKIIYPPWPESIEWFTEGQAFLAVVWFGSSPTLPPLLSKLDRRHAEWMRKKDNLLTGEGGRWWARSRIIRSQDSLALYKSFQNSLTLGEQFHKRLEFQRITTQQTQVHLRVRLRFCRWLIVFKHWTGLPDLSPPLCPYYVYA